MKLYLLVLLVAMAWRSTSAVEQEFSRNTLPGMSWLREMITGEEAVHSRKKRFVGLPKGSSMEVKWSLNLPFDTFTDYTAKFQLALPIKIPFPDAIIASRRSDDNAEYEHYNYYQYDEDQLQVHQRRRRQARQERSSIYTNMQAAFEKAGVDGRHCLLRVICDVAEAPFDQGLMGELLNTLLTASLAGRPDDGEHDRDYDHYIEAELHGKLNGKCEERYSKCKISPFDLIPNAIHTVA
ncbi:uncharacterized protein [Penaeus vannamei]|uniref:uncharacterized protein n=1 Tax=Penaeus vannamei TaxID=6689 RepID=UPI00387F8F24